jgi:hypothetical protein
VIQRRHVGDWPRLIDRRQVAERLQLHLRAMEAQLRGWTPVVTIHPPVIRSDLGRDWSGGYTCRG